MRFDRNEFLSGISEKSEVRSAHCQSRQSALSLGHRGAQLGRSLPFRLSLAEVGHCRIRHAEVVVSDRAIGSVLNGAFKDRNSVVWLALASENFASSDGGFEIRWRILQDRVVQLRSIVQMALQEQNFDVGFGNGEIPGMLAMKRRKFRAGFVYFSLAEIKLAKHAISG